MKTSEKAPVSRRFFLKGAAAGTAALVAAPEGHAAEAETEPAAAVLPPSQAAVDAEIETPPPNMDVMTEGRPGADFMVDVIKSLGFDYVCSNPGSSFRGFHESVINYGGNRAPEWITCLHEEIAIAVADGYAQVAGKPLLVAAHGTVGLQHAAMNLYNAFSARDPVYVIAGNTLDASMRRPGVEWTHSVQDTAAMVRDFIKWDDNPVSLTHFAESAVRAYKIMMTPPMAPVLLVADSTLQEDAIADESALRVPKLTLPAPPQGDSGAVAELARLLVDAEAPVLFAGRPRTQTCMDLLVELAETLQAPIQGGLPSRHPLSQRGDLGNADVIVGLEVSDLWGTVHAVRDQLHRTFRPLTRSDARLVSVGMRDLYTKSNYQDFQRYSEVDLAIAADVEATLPSLIEACRRLISADRRRVLEDRGRDLAANKERALERARADATYAWNASPISTDRLYAEIWDVIKDKDWASSGSSALWNADKQYRTMGGSGAGGLGWGPPSAVGAALAHRDEGRLFVKIQNDGDMMYAPGALWTAAHHRIPLLFVMRNNRAYHQEVMHLQRMANRHQRGATAASVNVGTKMEDPNIDYGMLARSMGLYGEGPITDPSDLGPALRRAVERVERGEPALLDVVTQPR